MSLFRRSLSTQDKLCLVMDELGRTRQQRDDALAQAAPSNAGRALAAVKKQHESAAKIDRMKELRSEHPGRNWRYAP